MAFQSETTDAGLALALGVQEVRPVDLVTAYGTLANGGKRVAHTTILTIKDRNGDACRSVRAAGRRAGRQPAGRLHRHGHPGRQHEPERQPVLGQVRASDGQDAPAPGDAQDRHEQRRQGPQRLRLHRPADRGGPRRRRLRPRRRRVERQQRQHPGLDAARPVFSIDVSTYVWQGFLQEASRKWPVTRFARPDGLARAEIDPVDRVPRRAAAASPSTSGSSRAPSRRTPSRRTPAASTSCTVPGVDETRFGALDGGRPRLAPARGTWSGHRRRPGPDPRRRTSTTARTSRTARSWGPVVEWRAAGRRARRRPASRPDARRQRRRSRPSCSRRRRAPRWPRCPARRRPRRRRHRTAASPSAEPTPTPTAEPTPDTHRRADARADRRADPDGRAHAEPRDADTRSRGRAGHARRRCRSRVGYPRERDRRRRRPGRAQIRPDHPRAVRLAGPAGERWVVLGRQRLGQDDAARRSRV